MESSKMDAKQVPGNGLYMVRIGPRQHRRIVPPRWLLYSLCGAAVILPVAVWLMRMASAR